MSRPPLLEAFRHRLHIFGFVLFAFARKLTPLRQHRLFRRLGRIAFYNLLLLTTLIFALLCFALDDSPSLVIPHGFNRDDIQQAKQLLYVAPEDKDKIKVLRLGGKELNIACNYLINHYTEATTLVQFLPEDRLWLQITLVFPENLWGRFLDFDFKLIQRNDAIAIKSLKIGEISIPDPAANYLVAAIVGHSTLEQYYDLARQYIKDIRIGADSVDISYLGAIVDDAKQLVRQKHKAYPSLHVYQQQINDIVSQHDPAWRLSLSELLQPLFITALQRSTGDNAIQENRAVLIAVASYIYKSDLRRFLPLGLIYSKEYPVFAYKRIDIPQHFIASALLTAIDSPLLAEQMGTDKEVGDSKNGSGFSFIDLTADRAGKRFGQLAITSPETARALQEKMANISDYSAIIPDINGLPEHMDETEFTTRYQSVGSGDYRAMVEQIDNHIDALPVYQ